LVAGACLKESAEETGAETIEARRAAVNPIAHIFLIRSMGQTVSGL